MQASGVDDRRGAVVRQELGVVSAEERLDLGMELRADA
jgi:hypothetical protein